MNNSIDVRTSLVSLLNAENICLDLEALVAEVLAAYARLNLWVCDKSKSPLSIEEFIEIGDICNKHLIICLNEIEAYKKTGNKEKLLKSLSDARDLINSYIIRDCCINPRTK